MDMELRPIPGTNDFEVHAVFRLSGLDAARDFSMLQAEELLAGQLNAIGLKATETLLSHCDTAGEALQSQGRKWTSKGQRLRVVESPHGPVRVMAHVYQTSAGGATRVPLAERARLIGSATPRLGRMVASKLAQMNCGAVARDLAENHQRPIAKSFAQDLGVAVAALATVRADSDFEQWHPLSEPREVSTIALGVDGAHLNTREDGWRQSMAGTLALYDKDGERLETLYAGGGPGQTAAAGKDLFFERMDQMLERVCDHYPKAKVIGLSDGAGDLQR